LGKNSLASIIHFETRILSRDSLTITFYRKANAKITTHMSGLRRILAEGLDQFFAQGFGNRFGFGMNLEFLVDVLQVKGDRMKRDAERVGGSFFVMSFD